MLASGMIAALFVTLVVGMAAFIIGTVFIAARRIGPVLLATCILFGWLGLTAVLATQGFFRDVSAVPPRIAFAVVPMLLTVIIITVLPATRHLLVAIAPAWLIAAQTFRIGVELVLWLLYREGTLPALLTFEGRNFDIIAGLSAPLIAWWVAQQRPHFASIATAWNIIGLLLVLNVAATGLLAAPSPYQVFTPDPPFMIVTGVPYVWLPGFLVPVAMLLHTLSLRQLLSR